MRQIRAPMLSRFLGDTILNHCQKVRNGFNIAVVQSVLTSEARLLPSRNAAVQTGGLGQPQPPGWWLQGTSHTCTSPTADLGVAVQAKRTNSVVCSSG